MKRRLVVTTPEADEDARRIDEWWTANREAAPDLFVEELAHAFTLLGMEAGVGVRYRHRTIPGLHRVLLRATLYHLYYVHSDDLVVVVGLWGATRGTSPRLGKRVASTKEALAAGQGTTAPGYVNPNRQEVVRATGLPGTDHLQRVYELRCQDCGEHYGANGSDNHHRKCPKCQNGRPGLPLE